MTLTSEAERRMNELAEQQAYGSDTQYPGTFITGFRAGYAERDADVKGLVAFLKECAQKELIDDPMDTDNLGDAYSYGCSNGEIHFARAALKKFGGET